MKTLKYDFEADGFVDEEDKLLLVKVRDSWALYSKDAIREWPTLTQAIFGLYQMGYLVT